ncbi:hypothetical protein HYPSUDRAFT_959762 [Hypholoma sublateritium FD-334 SS-4]|uniref:Uncharacterized protein n=1 Tax=Hypholoma sublateritium (strain FD-334 SS-4) TaxID=945553 RepID=A0A0D2PE23_HYPSF|nr:hypothetical protein HYPSUDRAFT_959762 [Hypholoma sublateritium FD-334 SS-4]
MSHLGACTGEQRSSVNVGTERAESAERVHKRLERSGQRQWTECTSQRVRLSNSAEGRNSGGDVIRLRGTGCSGGHGGEAGARCFGRIWGRQYLAAVVGETLTKFKGSQRRKAHASVCLFCASVNARGMETLIRSRPRAGPPDESYSFGTSCAAYAYASRGRDSISSLESLTFMWRVEVASMFGHHQTTSGPCFHPP